MQDEMAKKDMFDKALDAVKKHVATKNTKEKSGGASFGSKLSEGSLSFVNDLIEELKF